jgi:hypothetical protein
MRSAVLTELDLIAIGRVSADLYGQQIGSLTIREKYLPR